jgi:hypothetical protein
VPCVRTITLPSARVEDRHLDRQLEGTDVPAGLSAQFGQEEVQRREVRSRLAR